MVCIATEPQLSGRFALNNENQVYALVGRFNEPRFVANSWQHLLEQCAAGPFGVK